MQLAQPALDTTGQILLALLMAVAAAFDLRWRRIPNWLVLAGILAGLLWNTVGSGLPGLARAAAGLGVGFLLYFPLYLCRARGAGDVKLLAAAGTIAGPGNCCWIFLLTALLGGVVALALLLFRGRVRQTLFNVAWILREMLSFRAPYKSSAELDVTTTKGMRLPHAPLLALGTAALIVVVRFNIRL